MIETNEQTVAQSADAPAVLPEFRLLCRCAQSRMDDRAAEEIRHLVQDGIDWESLTEAAHWHNIAPLVGENLRKVCPEVVPAEILESLRGDYETNAQRTENLTAELTAIIAELRAAGLPAIPFKGPALALDAYDAVALRQFTNLDLLVRRRDAEQAGAALTTRGYRAVKWSAFMDEDAQLHLESKLGFQHPASGLGVELHCQIVPRRYCYRVNFEHLLARAQSVAINGHELPALCPEDTLVVLCLHAIKNGFWPSLKQVCDVAEMIKAHDQIHWRAVIDESARGQCARAVFLGLLLAHDLLGAPLPPGVHAEILRDPVVKPLADTVRTRLTQRQRGFVNLMDATRVHLSLRKGLLSKARYVFCIITTPSERDFQFLRWDVSLAQSYPIRLLKFAGKFVGQVRKAIFRR